MGYMKIQNLYRVQDLFSNFKKLYASEKVHGTSAHIAFKPGEAEGEQGQVLFFSGGADHATFCRLWDADALLSLHAELTKVGHPVTVYGEAYGGKLQGMRNVYGNDLRFIAFEVKVADRWLSMPKAFALATSLGLEFVPFKEIDGTTEAIEEAMRESSVVAVRRGVAEPKAREGVVLRPLEEFTMNNGARVIAKHKNPDFSENVTPRTLKEPTLDAPEEKLAEDYCTEMRFCHVLDKYTGPTAPEGIRGFIEAFKADVEAEAPPYEAEQLKGRKAVRVLSSAAATWFKARMRGA